MAPYRPIPTRRGIRDRGYDHYELEGLPVRRWRIETKDVAARRRLARPYAMTLFDFDTPLPHGLPKETHLMQPHAQQILHAARAGVLKQTSEPDADEDMAGEDDNDDDRGGDGDNVGGIEVEVAPYKAKHWTQSPATKANGSSGARSERSYLRMLLKRRTWPRRSGSDTHVVPRVYRTDERFKEATKQTLMAMIERLDVKGCGAYDVQESRQLLLATLGTLEASAKPGGPGQQGSEAEVVPRGQPKLEMRPRSQWELQDKVKPFRRTAKIAVGFPGRLSQRGANRFGGKISRTGWAYVEKEADMARVPALPGLLPPSTKRSTNPDKAERVGRVAERLEKEKDTDKDQYREKENHSQRQGTFVSVWSRIPRKEESDVPELLALKQPQPLVIASAPLDFQNALKTQPATMMTLRRKNAAGKLTDHAILLRDKETLGRNVEGTVIRTEEVYLPMGAPKQKEPDTLNVSLPPPPPQLRKMPPLRKSKKLGGVGRINRSGQTLPLSVPAPIMSLPRAVSISGTAAVVRPSPLSIVQTVRTIEALPFTEKQDQDPHMSYANHRADDAPESLCMRAAPPETYGDMNESPAHATDSSTRHESATEPAQSVSDTRKARDVPGV